jgi:hypothetical protein
MVGDYISTSLLAQQHVAVPSFAIGFTPSGPKHSTSRCPPPS